MLSPLSSHFLVEIVSRRVCWSQLPTEANSEESLDSEDGFFFPAGPSLKDSSLHAIPPHHTAAEIFKWQISKEYRGIFLHLQNM